MAADRTWYPGRHLVLLNSHLLKVASGEIRRLAVFMPPRHGKSELCSKYTPAWFLGRNPDRRVLLTAYEASFAAQWGGAARDVLAEYGPEIFDIRVRDDAYARDDWRIDGHKGGMQTAGVGGALTGKGGDLVIIDDPIKNAAEALSKTIRDQQEEWYKSTLRTRLEPEASIVLMMTRWNQEDLAGNRIRAMAEDITADRWTVLSLPALAKAGDPLGRRPGEALFPERFPRAELLATKATLGSFWWAALYDQDPRPEEGNIFKKAWWQYYQSNGQRYEAIIQSWDFAFKKTDGSCPVGCHVYGKIGAKKYLLDRLNQRLSFTESVKAVLAMLAKWPGTSAILIEDKANGPAVMDVLKSTIPRMIPYCPDTSKEARATAVSPEVEAGDVYLPHDAYWVTEFIDNCAAAPNGPMEDVDCMAQALLWIRTQWSPIEHKTGNNKRAATGLENFFR